MLKRENDCPLLKASMNIYKCFCRCGFESLFGHSVSSSEWKMPVLKEITGLNEQHFDGIIIVLTYVKRRNVI